MPTFTWVPDQGATRQVKKAVNVAAFGDGYVQRSADLINSSVESWSLSFTLRTKAEIEAITDFLDPLKGVSNFDWTTPKGDAQKFTCDTYSDSFVHDGDASLTATFKRVYEL